MRLLLARLQRVRFLLRKKRVSWKRQDGVIAGGGVGVGLDSVLGIIRAVIVGGGTITQGSTVTTTHAIASTIRVAAITGTGGTGKFWSP